MNNLSNHDDLKRMETEYLHRDGSANSIWSHENPAVRYLLRERSQRLGAALKECLELPEANILDVGCGGGSELGRLNQWGANATSLFGVDYLFGRIQNATKEFPRFGFAQANGAALPFKNGQFELVSQFTVFSAITNPALKVAMAAEMWRVVRPGGFVLWYDMRNMSPAVTKLGRGLHFFQRNFISPTALVNKLARKLRTVQPGTGHLPMESSSSTTVVPIDIDEVHRLFPHGEFVVQDTIGLYFSLVTAALATGELAVRQLEKVGRLKTHNFALIRKPA